MGLFIFAIIALYLLIAFGIVNWAVSYAKKNIKNEKSTEPPEQAPLFQVINYGETRLAPLALLFLVSFLFLFSAYKLPATLWVFLWPVLGILLWFAISLVKKSRQPWIVVRNSGLELNTAHKKDRLIVPWSNIVSFELSQPYKDQMIINLRHPMGIGTGQEKISQVIRSTNEFDIDPDDLLIKLSGYLYPANTDIVLPSYVPNKIPLADRIGELFASVILLSWATYGVVTNDFPLPTKHNPWHLHGIAAWLMFVAFIFGIANLLSWVIDHYDQRNNERQYRKFRSYAKTIGWSFCFFALLYATFVER